MYYFYLHNYENCCIVCHEYTINFEYFEFSGHSFRVPACKSCSNLNLMAIFFEKEISKDTKDNLLIQREIISKLKKENEELKVHFTSLGLRA